jgi:hypothetical protein
VWDRVDETWTRVDRERSEMKETRNRGGQVSSSEGHVRIATKNPRFMDDGT